jgi:hypothetical protein
MPSEEYKHYLLLPPENIISLLEEKDKEIKNLKSKLKITEGLKNKYVSYNNFHIEEITRLDKIIGKHNGLR